MPLKRFVTTPKSRYVRHHRPRFLDDHSVKYENKKRTVTPPLSTLPLWWTFLRFYLFCFLCQWFVHITGVFAFEALEVYNTTLRYQNTTVTSDSLVTFSCGSDSGTEVDTGTQYIQRFNQTFRADFVCNQPKAIYNRNLKGFSPNLIIPITGASCQHTSTLPSLFPGNVLSQNLPVTMSGTSRRLLNVDCVSPAADHFSYNTQNGETTVTCQSGKPFSANDLNAKLIDAKNNYDWGNPDCTDAALNHCYLDHNAAELDKSTRLIAAFTGPDGVLATMQNQLNASLIFKQQMQDALALDTKNQGLAEAFNNVTAKLWENHVVNQMNITAQQLLQHTIVLQQLDQSQNSSYQGIFGNLSLLNDQLNGYNQMTQIQYDLLKQIAQFLGDRAAADQDALSQMLALLQTTIRKSQTFSVLLQRYLLNTDRRQAASLTYPAMYRNAIDNGWKVMLDETRLGLLPQPLTDADRLLEQLDTWSLVTIGNSPVLLQDTLQLQADITILIDDWVPWSAPYDLLIHIDSQIVVVQRQQNGCLLRPDFIDYWVSMSGNRSLSPNMNLIQETYCTQPLPTIALWQSGQPASYTDSSTFQAFVSDEFCPRALQNQTAWWLESSNVGRGQWIWPDPLNCNVNVWSLVLDQATSIQGFTLPFSLYRFFLQSYKNFQLRSEALERKLFGILPADLTIMEFPWQYLPNGKDTEQCDLLAFLGTGEDMIPAYEMEFVEWQRSIVVTLTPVDSVTLQPIVNPSDNSESTTTVLTSQIRGETVFSFELPPLFRLLGEYECEDRPCPFRRTPQANRTDMNTTIQLRYVYDAPSDFLSFDAGSSVARRDTGSFIFWPTAADDNQTNTLTTATNTWTPENRHPMEGLYAFKQWYGTNWYDARYGLNSIVTFLQPIIGDPILGPQCRGNDGPYCQMRQHFRKFEREGTQGAQVAYGPFEWGYIATVALPQGWNIEPAVQTGCPRAPFSVSNVTGGYSMVTVINDLQKALDLALFIDDDSTTVGSAQNNQCIQRRQFTLQPQQPWSMKVPACQHLQIVLRNQDGTTCSTWTGNGMIAESIIPGADPLAAIHLLPVVIKDRQDTLALALGKLGATTGRLLISLHQQLQQAVQQPWSITNATLTNVTVLSTYYRLKILSDAYNARSNSSDIDLALNVDKANVLALLNNTAALVSQFQSWQKTALNMAQTHARTQAIQDTMQSWLNLDATSVAAFNRSRTFVQIAVTQSQTITKPDAVLQARFFSIWDDFGWSLVDFFGDIKAVVGWLEDTTCMMTGPLCTMFDLFPPLWFILTVLAVVLCLCTGCCGVQRTCRNGSNKE